MKKTIILAVIIISNTIFAQPYIYYPVNINDTTIDVELSTVMRLNLLNGNDEIFMDSTLRVYYLHWDSMQKWFFIIQYRSPTDIYDLNDISEGITLPDELSGLWGGFIYSGVNNKLYFFSVMENDDVQFSSLNLFSHNIDSLLTVPYKGISSNVVNEEAFLSSNESIIYFALADTNYHPLRFDKDRVVYFSTKNNQIVKERDLAEFGFPGAYAYLLHRGRKGKAIVESFINSSNHDDYFRVYDFDNDSGSDFICRSGYTDPFYTGDGEYLVLAEKTDSAHYLKYTGIFYVYNFQNGQLIKTLQFPPWGNIYNFDSYPDDIFYVIDVDSPKRQIFRINPDSLLNEERRKF